MSRKKDLQDLALCRAIGGCEVLQTCGVAIEEDYLRREREENRREAGYFVRAQIEGRTDTEKAIWKSAMQLSGLADERWAKHEEDEEAHLQQEFDDRYMQAYVPKTVVKV